ncbi:SGNH/GDSL hydrolase family protein [Enterovirga aerilata]|uniref:SGNH/GDSL hydrolase family protein n=1 Tax=Enterovirga aerilata TaxID=2730920 RepID=A0A849IE39_9HYPH|nr:SGNH/GDSL hydrolase family protein [Enterovirga sp. DB1703]NNM72153.1 SGNH/GDSL hydrolase family protein [Enterovirga sp. DB1703]
MPHLVLLGDSIFDNKAYVAGGPDVVAQVRDDLPAGWTATLCAVDGATTAGVRSQLARVPADATHLVLSIGGNDALGQSGVLARGARSVAEVLETLGEIGRGFERDYRAMLDLVLARGLPTALCTIYNPSYPEPARQRISVAALTFMNDPIVRIAAEHGLPLIDLRLVCTDPADYANPIEPSSRGGEKIAAAISGLVLNHDFRTRRSVIVR